MNRIPGILTPGQKQHSVGTVYGLTGGIASGKSTVARLLEKKGFPVIDADQISRELRQPGGAAIPLLEKKFGTSDPMELRKSVFSNPAARKDLEALMHPLIVAESQNRFRKTAESSTVPLSKLVMVYEAALLVETGRNKDLAGLIVVRAPQELRKERLILRDGLNSELASQMIAAQASDAERLQAATWIIDNTGSLQEVEAQVDKLIPQLVPR